MLYSRGWQHTRIIDRTIPEICRYRKDIDKESILQFCKMLMGVGVDIVEINSDILAKIDIVPSGLLFLCRVQSEDDIYTCESHKIKNVIIDEEMLSKPALLRSLIVYGIKTTIEFKADSLAEINRLKKQKQTLKQLPVSNLRVTGLSRFTSDTWARHIKQIGISLNARVDVCPENSCFSAASTAVEALTNGFDFITASFAGYGGDNGYAPLEEVLAAARFILNLNIEARLRLLPELSRLFMSLTGVGIHGSKPVIGSDIFNYESGIHADGINKNPITYEPYEPALVGLKRKLTIGKHSGTASVEYKLKKLGLECGVDDVPRILESIRDRSIKLQRNLYDQEIKEIYEAEFEPETVH